MLILTICLHLFTYIAICSCFVRTFNFQSNTPCDGDIEMSLDGETDARRQSVVACAMLCTEMPGCGGFLYYWGIKACYGVDADSPMLEACALPGTSFYKKPPPSWDYMGTSCYYLPYIGVMLPFYAALDYCSDQGGHLMQLETQTENDAMKTYLMNNYDTATWWIGLTDIVTEGDWLWVTDSTKPSFNDWIGPTDGGRDANYAILDDTAGWKNISRYGPYAFICEKAEC